MHSHSAAARRGFHGKSGRWGGRLTRKALPEPALELDGQATTCVVEAWLQRSASERRVGEAFAVIAHELGRLRAPAPLQALAARAIDDELRHAELCRRVGSIYAGRELDAPAPLPLTLPRHAEASHDLRPSLFVIGQSCFNETFASVVLETALARARDPLAVAALRELLSDEIDHARIGWWYLGTMSVAARGALAPWLLHLAQTNAAMWLASDRRTGPDELTSHGVLTPTLVRESVTRALTDLIVPGFAAAGLAPPELRAWTPSEPSPTSASPGCGEAAAMEPTMDG